MADCSAPAANQRLVTRMFLVWSRTRHTLRTPIFISGAATIKRRRSLYLRAFRLMDKRPRPSFPMVLLDPGMVCGNSLHHRSVCLHRYFQAGARCSSGCKLELRWHFAQCPVYSQALLDSIRIPPVGHEPSGELVVLLGRVILKTGVHHRLHPPFLPVANTDRLDQRYRDQ